MESFGWNSYTKKMREFLNRPLSVGAFSKEIAEMICLKGEVGDQEEGNWFQIEVMVDTTDGVIADVKYLFFGPTNLLLALEASSRFLVRKNVRQAAKISIDILDRFLRDQDSVPALTNKQTPYFMFVVEGVLEALSKAPSIEVSEYTTPFSGIDGATTKNFQENWEELTDQKRMEILEEVFEEHIRPYLAIDEGGVEILEIEEKTRVKIAYSGNCTSCFSAIGGTLQGIQNVLVERIHPKITVIPDLKNLQLS